jgi:hypothetical protein
MGVMGMSGSWRIADPSGVAALPKQRLTSNITSPLMSPTASKDHDALVETC